MVYIESPSTNPAFNLALEQYVFDRMDRSQEYFMLWQNDNTVVIGKNQNAFAEVNQKVADAKHISVVRRLSGGGAVYHDLGNLNFTFYPQCKGCNRSGYSSVLSADCRAAAFSQCAC